MLDAMSQAAITDAMLDDRQAIVGTAGSGKTFGAKGMAERLIDAGARVCIVDPLGVWWGLRAGADGSPAGGLPVVIFGGQHADVPVTEHDGAALGRIIAEADIRCIVDVSELGSGAARRRFMSGFAEAIYDANREPLHLILDESDLWAPQRPLPDQTALQGKIGEIVRRGRVRGFVPWLITQRPAVLDKDVLSQADTLIAMKLTSSQDRAAIGAWIEGQADREDGKRILAELPRLHRGTGFVWAPGHGMLERVTFPPIRTFDSSRTPKRGERLAASKLAAVDVSAIGAMLADQRQTDKPETAKRAGGAELAAAEQRGYERGLAEGGARIAELLGRIQEMQGAIDDALGFLAAHAKRENGVGVTAIDAQPVRETRAHVERARQPQPAAATGIDRMLRALAHRPGGLTESQWATLSAIKPTGGTWRTYKGKLRTDGLVRNEGELWFLTAAGTERVGPTARPQNGEELRALWASRLGVGPTRMMTALLHGPLSREALAEATGHEVSGGTFRTYLGKLTSNRLVERVGNTVRLVEELRNV